MPNTLNVSNARGPLRVSSQNSRYFTDNSGKAIYLTGSHFWLNGQDISVDGSNPPPAFDYDSYLDFIEERGHNFFRLWHWEQTHHQVADSNSGIYIAPHPWQRTGPGSANDGGLKFNLTLFNEAYFDRLRSRVAKAAQRGMYVSVMLFNGFSVSFPKNAYSAQNPWLMHPFCSANNINSLDGDSDNDDSGDETQDLSISAVTGYQEDYVEKVIDTLNHFDNVLWEICNEANSDATTWHAHFISHIHTYEASKPKQHPVGFTVQWPGGTNSEVNSSDAEWGSYNSGDGNLTAPPLAGGSVVSLWDTDHVAAVSYEATLVWRGFCRGHNILLMDEYDGSADTDDMREDAAAEHVRNNMGWAREYAERVDLINMTPSTSLASTGYCLAKTNAEYIAYRPSGSSNFTLDLAAASGTFNIEWFRPSTGATSSGGTTTGGATRTLTPPFSGEAVAYLYK